MDSGHQACAGGGSVTTLRPALSQYLQIHPLDSDRAQYRIQP